MVRHLSTEEERGPNTEMWLKGTTRVLTDADAAEVCAGADVVLDCKVHTSVHMENIPPAVEHDMTMTSARMIKSLSCSKLILMLYILCLISIPSICLAVIATIAEITTFSY